MKLEFDFLLLSPNKQMFQWQSAVRGELCPQVCGRSREGESFRFNCKKSKVMECEGANEPSQQWSWKTGNLKSASKYIDIFYSFIALFRVAINSLISFCWFVPWVETYLFYNNDHGFNMNIFPLICLFAFLIYKCITQKPFIIAK